VGGRRRKNTATIAMERTVNERQGERESKSESDERIDRETLSGGSRREKEREETSGEVRQVE